jgi:hypothetical protein
MAMNKMRDFSTRDGQVILATEVEAEDRRAERYLSAAIVLSTFRSFPRLRYTVRVVIVFFVQNQGKISGYFDGTCR